MSDNKRRFFVEELEQGWLVKVTEAGNDKYLSRHAFTDPKELRVFLTQELGIQAVGETKW